MDRNAFGLVPMPSSWSFQITLGPPLLIVQGAEQQALCCYHTVAVVPSLQAVAIGLQNC